MTRKEIIERNISLTFDFVHHLIDNNEVIEELPGQFDVEFVDKDFPFIETKSMPIQKESKNLKKYVHVKRTFSFG